MMNNLIYHRQCKRFKTEFALQLTNERGPLIVIGAFRMNQSDNSSIEEIALMMVTIIWIPYNNADKFQLIKVFSKTVQKFIQCLRINLTSTIPTASGLLSDLARTVTEMFFCLASGVSQTGQI